MGEGRLPLWTGVIYPFRSRPDKGVNVIWYAVPEDRPGPLYPTPHLTRFWEPRAHWTFQPPGLDPASMRRAEFRIPPGNLVEFSGTAAEWDGDIDYEKWLAGGYSNAEGCWPTNLAVLAPHQGVVLDSTS